MLLMGAFDRDKVLPDERVFEVSVLTILPEALEFERAEGFERVFLFILVVIEPPFELSYVSKEPELIMFVKRVCTVHNEFDDAAGEIEGWV